MSVFRLLGGGSARAFTRLPMQMRDFPISTAPSLRVNARSFTVLQRPSQANTEHLRIPPRLLKGPSPSRSIHHENVSDLANSEAIKNLRAWFKFWACHTRLQTFFLGGIFSMLLFQAVDFPHCVYALQKDRSSRLGSCRNAGVN
jgi:hypothetical protein